MRYSKVASKLRNNQPTRLAMLGYFIPPFIAFAADAGFDGIWLDLEHRAMDHREVQALLTYGHLYDIDILVRTPTREKSQLYRYLEDGASAIIVPHVSTPQEAADLVKKVKFPPLGDRGLNGATFEANFGLDIPNGRQPLVDHALKETLLIVQPETPEAFRNIDEIASIEGVDGFFVGPADLAVRMQHEPADQQFTHDDVLEKLATACQKHHKAWGTIGKTPADLQHYQANGAQFILWGIDVAIMQQGLQSAKVDLDTFLG